MTIELNGISPIRSTVSDLSETGVSYLRMSEKLRNTKNSEVVTDFPYRGGKFSGVMVEGKPFNGEVKGVDILYKRFDGLVKEGALAYPDRGRFQREGTVTPFQSILREDRTPFQRLEKDAAFSAADDAMRRSVLNIDSQYIKLNADQKFDVNNDNQRRVFDTFFSKELLTNIVEDKHKMAEVRKLSDSIVNYYKSTLLSDKFADWESARKGTYAGTDGRFQQLVTQNERAIDAVDNLNIGDDAKKLLVDLYQRRYLNYLIDETDIYKEDHPEGIIKSKSNPLYFKRGRLDGDFGQSESMNVGILRNVDKSPVDLRFSILPDKKPGIAEELYTRCPDRLNMADPSGVVDKDADSWLSYNFMSGNTPFVNGLSGSMLIEIRGMLYLKGKLESDGGQEDFLASPAMIEVLNNYFSAISGLYVYIDGGHSLFEIQSSFKQTWVKSAFISTFEGVEWGAVGQSLYDDVEAYKRAYQDTKIFDKVLQRQDAVISQLNNLDPASQSLMNSKTKELALRQSVEGRRVLYRPGEELIQELRSAATVLKELISGLTTEGQNEFCAHLIGEGFLFSLESVGDVVAALERVGETGSTSSREAAAKDRAAVIGLMGDLGGFYSTPATASSALMSELNSMLTEMGLFVPSAEEVQNMRDWGGSSVVGPNKRKERHVKIFGNRNEIPIRAGVHNLGGKADDVLEVEPQSRIPGTRWSVFEINAARVKESSEPLVGHMSGSPSEILQAWDMLCGELGGRQFIRYVDGSAEQSAYQSLLQPISDLTPDEQAQRYARAAGASAFLVGLGYHSAVEVVEGTLTYLGESIRVPGVLPEPHTDAVSLFGHGAATDILTELFRGNSI